MDYVQKNFFINHVPHEVKETDIRSALRMYNIGLQHVCIRARLEDNSRFCKLAVFNDSEAHHLRMLGELTVRGKALHVVPSREFTYEDKEKQEATRASAIIRHAKELDIDLLAALKQPVTFDHTCIARELFRNTCKSHHTIQERGKTVRLFRTANVDMRTNEVHHSTVEPEEELLPRFNHITQPETPLHLIERHYSTPNNFATNLPLCFDETPILGPVKKTEEEEEGGGAAASNALLKDLAAERRRRMEGERGQPSAGSTPVTSKSTPKVPAQQLTPPETVKPTKSPVVTPVKSATLPNSSIDSLPKGSMDSPPRSSLAAKPASFLATTPPKSDIPTKSSIPAKSAIPAKGSISAKSSIPAKSAIPAKSSIPAQEYPSSCSAPTVMPLTPPATPPEPEKPRSGDLPYLFHLHFSSDILDGWFASPPTSPTSLTAPVNGRSLEDPVIPCAVPEPADDRLELLNFLLQEVDSMISSEEYSDLSDMSLQAHQLLADLEGAGLISGVARETEQIAEQIQQHEAVVRDLLQTIGDLEESGAEDLAEELREVNLTEEEEKMSRCRADLLFLKLLNAKEYLQSESV